MKKNTLALLIICAMLGLAGCTGREQPSAAGSIQDGNNSQAAASSAAVETAVSSATPAEESIAPVESDGLESSTLVAYFSATGTTAAIADYIASITGADEFEIRPTTPYTQADLDWRDENSRTSVEHAQAERTVELETVTPESWDAYKTVYIGYPIWWGEAAWPVDTFVGGNDFSGKTVIPFCTSGSSGIGESAKSLENLAGTGTWLEGQRFSGSASEEDVKSWIAGLDK